MPQNLRRTLLLAVLSIAIACGAVLADPWLNHAQQTFAQSATQNATASPTVLRQAVVDYLTRSGETTTPRIDRTAIEGNFALVLWTQGEAGGTALARSSGGTWQVLLSGGGLIGVQEMVQKGVPKATAESLLTQIDPNWRSYGIQ